MAFAQQLGLAAAAQQALSLPQQAIFFAQQSVETGFSSAQLRLPKARPTPRVMPPNGFANMIILQKRCYTKDNSTPRTQDATRPYRSARVTTSSVTSSLGGLAEPDAVEELQRR